MKFFETASFHIVKPCNMKCKFCYATFDDMHVGKQLTEEEMEDIIWKLKKAGLEKITFAGGEPMLYKHLDQAIKFSKFIGLTTSIITNGSMITDKWLDSMVGELDWIGLSVDSTSAKTNELIGRNARNQPDYYNLVHSINTRGFKLKINTVVNAFNWQESLNSFITYAKPSRWKVFQALRIEGQNDKDWDSIKVYKEEFENFLFYHNQHKCLVSEDNLAMTGSYLLIDPQGRLFENSSGKHTYSEPLQNSTVETCLGQINLNREMFEQRGGVYKW